MREPVQYLLRVAAHGVVTTPRPRHVAYSACREHRIQQRAAKARRCAKEQRGAADDAGDGSLRSVDLPLQCAQTEERERMGMAIRMVFDAMAATCNRPYDFGKRCGFFADAEKTRFSIVAVEEVEYFQGDAGVRPVVKSQTDFSARCGRPGETGHVGAEPVPARPQD